MREKVQEILSMVRELDDRHLRMLKVYVNLEVAEREGNVEHILSSDLYHIEGETASGGTVDVVLDNKIEDDVLRSLNKGLCVTLLGGDSSNALLKFSKHDIMSSVNESDGTRLRILLRDEM